MSLEAYPAPSMTNKERSCHLSFMREAITLAQIALEKSETPVGCVLVYNDHIIGRGINDTNRSFNGTRHAEFMALEDVLSQRIYPDSAKADAHVDVMNKEISPTQASEGHEAESINPPRCGGRRFSPQVLKKCTLYVTVEPCIMCASLLRQVGIKQVFFGAANDKFGGTGGVLSVHKHDAFIQKASQELSEKIINRDFEVSGGWLREEAILLLRRFYVQENERAPQPRDKSSRILNLVIDSIDR